MNAVIIIPAYTHIHWQLFTAMLESQVMFSPVFGKSDLPKARSKLFTSALEQGADRVVCIDADVIPTAAQVLALATDPRVTPTSAVSGLYVQRNLEHWAFKTEDPTIDADGYMKGEAAGLGFCCIHRASLEAVAAALPTVVDEGTWKPFCVPLLVPQPDGTALYQADDFSLWRRLRDAGVQLWGKSDLVVGHAFESVHYGPER